ncbi:hypothetical protein P171DRAFT_485052 [Karstenula rhodostoma CBS 690.94]|uniref:Uncharacterized protein n=1 Tax=Karstenula rhodostoma CBS 690.94 TaxID=1392251 RepID=A0A9P4PIV0_9PLEO|nr:hypothetical protein P171DRAFT_485052 [Karstenula rhodostoma CBS 690.94]
MPPVRKSTSKKKKAATSASSRVHPRCMNVVAAVDGTTAQNDVVNLTTSGERSYKPPYESPASSSRNKLARQRELLST